MIKQWLWHTLRCIKSRASDLSSMSWLKLSTLSEKLFCAYCSNIALSTLFPVIGRSKRESGLIREHNTWLHWSTVYVVYGIVSEFVDDVWSVLGLWEANTNYHQYPIFCNFLLMIILFYLSLLVAYPPKFIIYFNRSCKQIL